MIPQSGRHALRAVVELAGLQAGRYEGVGALARRTGAPANYLGKLLQVLVGSGVLESRKGPGGGFRLARPAAEITLLDIVEPLADLAGWNECILGLPVCSDETACRIHGTWDEMRSSYMRMLSGTILADLIIARDPGPEGRQPTKARTGGDR
ncbi:MAG TPA: Rrf2 family transcriptional regulator [Candidatus Saccharimonadales bacterium]|nr:Rrf2 family transcriptional regulator [Candidatus Saccharimonadales bacterium]